MKQDSINWGILEQDFSVLDTTQDGKKSFDVQNKLIKAILEKYLGAELNAEHYKKVQVKVIDKGSLTEIHMGYDNNFIGIINRQAEEGFRFNFKFTPFRVE
ncbi:MAG: hypothetical protein AAF620_15265 [Bacteroidota bacterium]